MNNKTLQLTCFCSLVLPFFTLFIGLAAAADPFIPGDWLFYTFEQIFFGLLTGIVVGRLGGWLLGMAGNRGWIEESI